MGNRLAIEDSADQTHNAMTAILLQEIGDFPADGMLIAAMNNYTPDKVDPAFARRFSFEIGFKKPGQNEREKIWAAKLSDVPHSEDVNCEALAGSFTLTGAEIELACRNAVIDALAANETCLTNERIHEAARMLTNSSLRGGGGKPMGFGAAHQEPIAHGVQ